MGIYAHSIRLQQARSGDRWSARSCWRCHWRPELAPHCAIESVSGGRRYERNLPESPAVCLCLRIIHHRSFILRRTPQVLAVSVCRRKENLMPIDRAALVTIAFELLQRALRAVRSGADGQSDRALPVRYASLQNESGHRTDRQRRRQPRRDPRSGTMRVPSTL